MKCVIIAAGKGTRLSGVGDSKPLIPLLGKPLIWRVIETARQAGVDEFCIVTGYKADKITAELTPLCQSLGIPATFIFNPQWELNNGLSVLTASEIIAEPFFLLMSDHMFDPSVLIALGQMDISHCAAWLAVDTRLENNLLVDLDDVTKVRVENGLIRDIGKTISPYNAFDTGIFYCTPRLFGALEQSIAAGDSSLSGGMRFLAHNNQAGVMDIGARFWIDVDNEEMLKKAEIILVNRGG